MWPDQVCWSSKCTIEKAKRANWRYWYSLWKWRRDHRSNRNIRSDGLLFPKEFPTRRPSDCDAGPSSKRLAIHARPATRWRKRGRIFIRIQRWWSWKRWRLSSKWIGCSCLCCWSGIGSWRRRWPRWIQRRPWRDVITWYRRLVRHIRQLESILLTSPWFDWLDPALVE